MTAATVRRIVAFTVTACVRSSLAGGGRDLPCDSAIASSPVTRLHVSGEACTVPASAALLCALC